jgi:hypothetical protein
MMLDSLNGKKEVEPLVIPLPSKQTISKEQEEKYAEAARIVEERKKKNRDALQNGSSGEKKFGLVLMKSKSDQDANTDGRVAVERAQTAGV